VNKFEVFHNHVNDITFAEVSHLRYTPIDIGVWILSKDGMPNEESFKNKCFYNIFIK